MESHRFTKGRAFFEGRCIFCAAARRETAGRWTLEWADIVRDLDHFDETTIIVDEKPYVIRSEIKGTLGKVFQAAGVAIPPALRPA